MLSDSRTVVCHVLSVLSVALVYCGQMVGWIGMPLDTKVGLGPGHIVLDDDPAPPPQKKGHSPIFGPCLFGQMVGWIGMPLDTKVGLGPGHIVLDGDPAPSPKGAQQPPLFGPCLLWPNGRPSQQLLSSRCTIMQQLTIF